MYIYTVISLKLRIKKIMSHISSFNLFKQFIPIVRFANDYIL